MTDKMGLARRTNRPVTDLVCKGKIPCRKNPELREVFKFGVSGEMK